jgi:hypothetical protein
VNNFFFVQVCVLPRPTYISHLAADSAREHHDQLLEENLGKERAKQILESAVKKLMYLV